LDLQQQVGPLLDGPVGRAFHFVEQGTELVMFGLQRLEDVAGRHWHGLRGRGAQTLYPAWSSPRDLGPAAKRRRGAAATYGRCQACRRRSYWVCGSSTNTGLASGRSQPYRRAIVASAIAVQPA